MYPSTTSYIPSTNNAEHTLALSFLDKSSTCSSCEIGDRSRKSFIGRENADDAAATDCECSLTMMASNESASWRRVRRDQVSLEPRRQVKIQLANRTEQHRSFSHPGTKGGP